MTNEVKKKLNSLLIFFYIISYKKIKIYTAIILVGTLN